MYPEKSLQNGLLSLTEWLHGFGAHKWPFKIKRTKPAKKSLFFPCDHIFQTHLPQNEPFMGGVNLYHSVMEMATGIFWTSKCPESATPAPKNGLRSKKQARRASKMRPSEERSPRQRFVRDFHQKRKMKELLQCFCAVMVIKKAAHV
jgi:hypothetical protein